MQPWYRCMTRSFLVINYFITTLSYSQPFKLHANRRLSKFDFPAVQKIFFDTAKALIPDLTLNVIGQHTFLQKDCKFSTFCKPLMSERPLFFNTYFLQLDVNRYMKSQSAQLVLNNSTASVKSKPFQTHGQSKHRNKSVRNSQDVSSTINIFSIITHKCFRNVSHVVSCFCKIR